MGRSSAAAKPQRREADTKLAQGRLSVLELAKELGNVAEACRLPIETLLGQLPETRARVSPSSV